jgi:hypothetical protein
MSLNGEIDTAIESLVGQLVRLQRLIWEKTVLSPGRKEGKENE